ncbi:MAG: right-handed parallel beta-helix repeat-containing protein [Lewinella sp.]|nr:right-handed parallel beta-helix repeat-containing protein [Lewinella sp.]
MYQWRRFPLILTSLTVLVFSFWACDPEETFVTGEAVNISFSVDTLRFDTVFTELGSATRSVKIYNNGDEPVKLDKVYVEGTTGVSFQINVDGTHDEVVEDVIIWENDSIYVFVEVIVDPDEPLSVSPYVVEDFLVVETGAKRNELLLEAWGQNANYFPSRFNQGVAVTLSCSNGTLVWDSPLPYVIYGRVAINQCLLEVAAGTRIYVHGGIAQTEEEGAFNDGLIYTFGNGRIHLAGTADNPVIIQGDRLEEEFQDESGQWLGIALGPGTTGNLIEYTEIKNGIFGIYVDSTAEVTLRNSIIHTTSSSAILGKRATVNATNCLFYDNGSNALQFIQGGDYNFDYCTVANYGVDASALAVSNFQCYDDFCEAFTIYRLRGNFRNCIFFGSRRDEIIISDASERDDPSLMVLNMRNCVVKTDELLTRSGGLYADFFDTYCVNCVNGERDDPLFLDRGEDDYHLDTLSIAQGVALPITGLTTDLEGTPRDAEPDAGCYERVE